MYVTRLEKESRSCVYGVSKVQSGSKYSNSPTMLRGYYSILVVVPSITALVI